MKTIGQQIQEARSDHGITQGELASKIGLLHQSNIARIESGKVSPTVRTVSRIAEALGVTFLIEPGQEATDDCGEVL